MGHSLEAPAGGEAADLYRAREDEVADHRPCLTGDIFEKVSVNLVDGARKNKSVMVIQHPCAMRSNGVDLVPRLLVAEVRQHRPLELGEWCGFGKLMPLPELLPSITSGRRNQAVFFDELHLVRPEDLVRRIACLSPFGINLLLQRWVHHNSRVVVPTATYNEVTRSFYEEADLIEEWCEERAGAEISTAKATGECVAWLREEIGDGRIRQELLHDPQNWSIIRKQMRAALRALRV